MSEVPQTNEHEPISCREAARRIGFEGDWRTLLNHLRAREMSYGVRFVDTFEGPKKNRFRVTVAAIRFYAPDLMDPKISGPVAHQPTRSQAVDIQKFYQALSELSEKAAEVAAEQISKRVRPECLLSRPGYSPSHWKY